MTESACTDSCSSEGIGSDIENDVVGALGVAGNPAYTEQVIESQIVSNAPGDVVIGARSIAANSNSPDDHLSRSIQREPATEDVDAANLVTHHRIIGGADVLGRPAVCLRRIDRVTVLQSEEAAARLHSRVQIRS